MKIRESLIKTVYSNQRGRESSSDRDGKRRFHLSSELGAIDRIWNCTSKNTINFNNNISDFVEKCAPSQMENSDSNRTEGRIHQDWTRLGQSVPKPIVRMMWRTYSKVFSFLVRLWWGKSHDTFPYKLSYEMELLIEFAKIIIICMTGHKLFCSRALGVQKIAWVLRWIPKCWMIFIWIRLEERTWSGEKEQNEMIALRCGEYAIADGQSVMHANMAIVSGAHRFLITMTICT